MSCSCTNNSTVLPIGYSGNDGTNGTDGIFGGFSGKWVFSTSTSAGPSSTQIRLNNATYSSVTNIYVSDTNFDSVSYDAFLDSLSNNNNFGLIRIYKEFDNTKFWLGQVTAVTDNGTDHTIAVTYISHSSSFSASDNLILSFTPSGASVSSNIEYKLWDTDISLVAGTNKSTVIIGSIGEPAATTADRVVTLTPGSDNSNFRIILLHSLIVGAGFTYKVKDSSGNTLLTLTAGSQPNRTFDFLYSGSSYATVEAPSTIIDSSIVASGYPVGEKKLIRAEYDYAVDGGAIGSITLSEKIPAGSLVYLDEVVIHPVTALTSGGAATLSLGLSGVTTDAIDSIRPYNVLPYSISTGSVQPTKIERFGTLTGNSGTINKREGIITSGTLTNAAAYATSTTITLTNSYITTNSRIIANITDYSGTILTNGVPTIVDTTITAGQVVWNISNAHPTNALNGTINLSFKIFEERITLGEVYYLPSASSITITVATATLTAGKFYVYVPYQIIG